MHININVVCMRASQLVQWSRIHLTMQETQEMGVLSLGWEDPLEEEIATHSSILAWEILWTKEPGELQSTESQRVRDKWVTEHARVSLSLPKPLTSINLNQWCSFPQQLLSAWNLMFDEHWMYLNQLYDLGQLIILYPWASFHHLFCQIGTLNWMLSSRWL